MTQRAHLARERPPLPTTPLTEQGLDALDARVRDDVGPPDGLAGVVFAIETLAAVARAWLRASAELRSLRIRLAQRGLA